MAVETAAVEAEADIAVEVCAWQTEYQSSAIILGTVPSQGDKAKEASGLNKSLSTKIRWVRNQDGGENVQFQDTLLLGLKQNGRI